jgi:transposase
MSSKDEKPKNENHKAINRAKNQIGILQDTVHKQSRKISNLEKENERLKQDVERLKKELAAKRQIPKWVKPNKSEEQIENAKKKGPKPGHPSYPRPLPENADQTIVIFPESCPAGHGELPFPSPSRWHTHMQIDLPEPGKPIVTEFLVGSSYCAGCGKYHSTSGRIGWSLYGPRLHAQICYWKYSLGLTLLKIQKLLMDQYSLHLSTGQVSEIISRTASKFADAYDDLKTSLHDQSHLHVDETGWRIDGKNAWLWSFSNQDVSIYTIDPSRGQGVVEEVLGEVFGGVLCSDFYGAYHRIQCAKQKCWAHILRDLKNLREKEPNNLEIQYFASRLKEFFDRGKQLRETRANGREIGPRLRRLKEETEMFAERKHRHRDLQILAKRLVKYQREMYTFIEKNLEPTNNNAEREIRPAVLMRKTSYGNRSDQGRKNQSIMMSIIRTAEKRSQNFVSMAVEHLSACQ